MAREAEQWGTRRTGEGDEAGLRVQRLRTSTQNRPVAGGALVPWVSQVSCGLCAPNLSSAQMRHLQRTILWATDSHRGQTTNLYSLRGTLRPQPLPLLDSEGGSRWRNDYVAEPSLCFQVPGQGNSDTQVHPGLPYQGRGSNSIRPSIPMFPEPQAPLPILASAVEDNEPRNAGSTVTPARETKLAFPL